MAGKRGTFLPRLIAAVAAVTFLLAFIFRNHEDGDPGYLVGAVGWYGLWVSIAAFLLWFIWSGFRTLRRGLGSR
jgi:hypothetical protein